jgi:uncharacterized protein (TIGR03084 family)
VSQAAKILGVLPDLSHEGDWLESLVVDLPESGWRRPTPAEGWDVATTIAHLAWTDECAVLAARAGRSDDDKAAWDEVVLKAIGDPDGFVDSEARAGAAVPPEELLARWRHSRQELARVLADHGDERMPWFGPPMSATSMGTARYMETWAHGLDIAAGLEVEVEPHDRVRHVVHLGVRTRDFAYRNRGEEPPEAAFRVELRSPGGETWSYGPDDASQRVTGSAWDFAVLVTQRGHRADLDVQAEGGDADHWLDIAQAFAGPSGDGRPPRGEPQAESGRESRGER